MMSLLAKPKAKSKPPPSKPTTLLKQPGGLLDGQLSDEEELSDPEEIGKKLARIEEEKERKRSLWGSHTMEKSIDPEPSDDDDDDDEDGKPKAVDDDLDRPFREANEIFLRQNETTDVETALANNRRPLPATPQAQVQRQPLSPYQMHPAPTATAVTLPVGPHQSEEHVRSWARYYASRNHPFPRELAAMPAATTAAAAEPPKKKKSKKPDLTPELLAFRFENKDRLICGDEMNPRNKENPGPYNVAQCIEFGNEAKGNCRKIDLRTLGSDAIRKLAANFGCEGVSSASMFECRQKMAVRKTAGVQCGNLDMPNPLTTAAEKRVNSWMRAGTVCFLPQNVDQVIKLNDNKARAEMEAAGGGSPCKKFWKDASALFNDSEANDEINALYHSLVDNSKQLQNLVDGRNINLVDFNTADWKTLCWFMRDVFKAIENIDRAMKQSGIHCNDFWSYCRKTFLKARKGVEVPPIVAFYIKTLCKEHPGIQGNFAQCLEDHLKSDSTTSPGAGRGNAVSGIATKSKNVDPDKFLDAIESTSKQFQDTAEEDREQRQKLIDLQVEMKEKEAQKVEEQKISNKWQECDKLSVRVMSLRKAVRKSEDSEDEMEVKTHLYNLASRVRTLEDDLGIDEDNSIVLDCLSRPDPHADWD